MFQLLNPWGLEKYLWNLLHLIRHSFTYLDIRHSFICSYCYSLFKLVFFQLFIFHLQSLSQQSIWSEECFIYVFIFYLVKGFLLYSSFYEKMKYIYFEKTFFQQLFSWYYLRVQRVIIVQWIVFNSGEFSIIMKPIHGLKFIIKYKQIKNGHLGMQILCSLLHSTAF